MNAACKQKKRADKRATLAGLLLGPLSYHACERAAMTCVRPKGQTAATLYW